MRDSCVCIYIDVNRVHFLGRGKEKLPVMMMMMISIKHSGRPLG